MKHIEFACLEQTLHFTPKDGVEGKDAIIAAVREEVQHYKEQLAHNRVKHVIVDETQNADGSVTLKIKKQYNAYQTGTYLA